MIISVSFAAWPFTTWCGGVEMSEYKYRPGRGVPEMMSKETFEEQVRVLARWDIAYRNGKPHVDDITYDHYERKLLGVDPDNPHIVCLRDFGDKPPTVKQIREERERRLHAERIYP